MLTEAAPAYVTYDCTVKSATHKTQMDENNTMAFCQAYAEGKRVPLVKVINIASRVSPVGADVQKTFDTITTGVQVTFDCTDRNEYPTTKDLNVIGKWVNTYYRSAVMLAKFLKKGTGYNWSRDGGFMDWSTNVAHKLGYSKKDNWNPADIWVVSQKKENWYKTHIEEVVNSSLELDVKRDMVNRLLNIGMRQQHVIGVSLKKISKKGKLQEVNFAKNQTDEVEKAGFYSPTGSRLGVAVKKTGYEYEKVTSEMTAKSKIHTKDIKLRISCTSGSKFANVSMIAREDKGEAQLGQVPTKKIKSFFNSCGQTLPTNTQATAYINNFKNADSFASDLTHRFEKVVSYSPFNFPPSERISSKAADDGFVAMYNFWNDNGGASAHIIVTDEKGVSKTQAHDACIRLNGKIQQLFFFEALMFVGDLDEFITAAILWAQKIDKTLPPFIKLY